MFRKKEDAVFVPHRDGIILCVGKAISVSPMQSRVLNVLLDAAPNPVPLKEIFRVGWKLDPETHNASSIVRQHLFDLRRALRGTPCWIEATRSGYRLRGPMKHQKFEKIGHE